MAGYSGTPLFRKLGIKGGQRLMFVAMPESVGRVLEPLPEGVVVLAKGGRGDADLIHAFALDEAGLAKMLPGLKKALHEEGALWISWRKGRDETDLTENVVRRHAQAAGLVDVKVCAVDETWSALKLVYRVEDRGRSGPRKTPPALGSARRPSSSK